MEPSASAVGQDEVSVAVGTQCRRQLIVRRQPCQRRSSSISTCAEQPAAACPSSALFTMTRSDGSRHSRHRSGRPGCSPTGSRSQADAACRWSRVNGARHARSGPTAGYPASRAVDYQLATASTAQLRISCRLRRRMLRLRPNAGSRYSASKVGRGCGRRIRRDSPACGVKAGLSLTSCVS